MLSMAFCSFFGDFFIRYTWKQLQGHTVLLCCMNVSTIFFSVNIKHTATMGMKYVLGSHAIQGVLHDVFHISSLNAFVFYARNVAMWISLKPKSWYFDLRVLPI